MRKILREEIGITLIALVITIIVLLILAGVTIQTLTGDNGLLQKAGEAKQANEEASALEKIKLAVSSAQLKGEGTLTTTNLNKELQINFNNDKIEIHKVPIGWIYDGYTICDDGKVRKGEILVPKEFQQLEYIESTGTQFVNTEVYPKSTTKVIFDFQATEKGGGNGWGSAGNNEAFLWNISSNYLSYVNKKWNSCLTDVAFDYNRHKFILYSGCQLFDGIKYGETTIGDTATNKQYMYIFAEHWEWENRSGNYSKRCRRFL